MNVFLSGFYSQDFLTEKISGCLYDYVAVYDGKTNTSTKLAQLCGLKFPDDIFSSGPSLFINFVADADVAGTGFNLTYEIMPKSGNLILIISSIGL